MKTFYEWLRENRQDEGFLRNLALSGMMALSPLGGMPQQAQAAPPAASQAENTVLATKMSPIFGKVTLKHLKRGDKEYILCQSGNPIQGDPRKKLAMQKAFKMIADDMFQKEIGTVKGVPWEQKDIRGYLGVVYTIK